MSETDEGFLAAIEEARQGYAEGGVPIGESRSKEQRITVLSAC